MTETQPPPPQSTSQTSSQPSSAAPDDPLSHLHKMSTTAGLGSADYVAVNGAAVATLLLGLASALVLLEEFLLIIPIAALVVAVIAWRQIRGSSGTQTGRGLIVVGLICALGFGGFVIARQATEGMRTREDRAAIAALIQEIGDKTRSGDYATLYDRFSDRFKEAVPREEFQARLTSIRESEIYGKLEGTSWNGLAEFETDPATGARFAAAKIDFNVEKTDRPLAVNVSLSKGPQGWQVEAMPDLFRPTQPPQPQRE